MFMFAVIILKSCMDVNYNSDCIILNSIIAEKCASTDFGGFH